MLASLSETDPYVSTNWLAQFERYPWTQDPYRLPGVQTAQQLQMDLRGRIDALRLQVSSVAQICSCRVSEGARITVEPRTTIPPFSVFGGIQAVIDLQTGNLYLSKNPLELAKPAHTDWQQFIQFVISA